MLVDLEVQLRLQSHLRRRFVKCIVAVLTGIGFECFAAVLRQALQLHDEVVVGLRLWPLLLEEAPSFLQAEALALDEVPKYDGAGA